jgi:hypothetical protein
MGQQFSSSGMFKTDSKEDKKIIGTKIISSYALSSANRKVLNSLSFVFLPFPLAFIMITELFSVFFFFFFKNFLKHFPFKL